MIHFYDGHLPSDDHTPYITMWHTKLQTDIEEKGQIRFVCLLNPTSQPFFSNIMSRNHPG